MRIFLYCEHILLIIFISDKKTHVDYWYKLCFCLIETNRCFPQKRCFNAILWPTKHIVFIYPLPSRDIRRSLFYWLWPISTQPCARFWPIGRATPCTNFNRQELFVVMLMIQGETKSNILSFIKTVFWISVSENLQLNFPRLYNHLRCLFSR